MTFLTQSNFGIEKSKRESNPISKLLYTYLYLSAFLANLTPTKKQSFKVKSEFKSQFHGSNS